MDTRTYTETAELMTSIERNQTPVRMTSPDGRTVKVSPGQAERRLAAGWTFAE